MKYLKSYKLHESKEIEDDAKMSFSFDKIDILNLIRKYNDMEGKIKS